MNSFKERLKKGITVYDGAMGTMLQKMGLRPDECPEVWSIEKKDKIQAIHKMYKDAGCDVITTNTFGANREKLSSYNLRYSVEELNMESVMIAKEVIRDTGYAALSVGPTGKMFEPFGTMTFNKAYEIFKEQISAAVSAGVDIISIETMGDLTEARAAVLAAKETCSLPITCTMTFQQNKRTIMGTDPATCVNVLQALGVDAAGANCSMGPVELIPVIKHMKDVCSIALMVQPNAGSPAVDNEQAVYILTPEEMAEFAGKFADMGVTVIGGCCGTTPEHISRIREKVKGHERINNYSKRNFISSSFNTNELDPVDLDKYNIAEVIIKDIITHSDNGAGKVLEYSAQDIFALSLNFSGVHEDRINQVRDLIIQIQSTFRIPIILEGVETEYILNAILRNYKGRVGVKMSGNQCHSCLRTIRKYGAVVL